MGLFLVGDMGFEGYKSIPQFLRAEAKKQARGEMTGVAIGFANIATHAAILEQQQQSRKANK